MTDAVFFCRLTHEGILAVQGSDAETFLQGQLTCQVKFLASGISSLGARCTAKGRMQSSFRMLKAGDEYLLAMDQALIEPQLADLKKYALFSKSRLHDASTEWTRWGLSSDTDSVLTQLGLSLAPEANAVARSEQALAVRLFDGRVELWAQAAQTDVIQQQLSQQLPEAPLNTWLLAQIRAGIGQVFAATREAFIPQMINLQCLGGVSFKKGCYTGQEIVARTQHLGKIKRQLYRLTAASMPNNAPSIGAPLFAPSHSSSVGDVVLVARSEAGLELLAVLQEDAFAEGDIRLEAPDGFAVHPATPPYSPSADDAQR